MEVKHATLLYNVWINKENRGNQKMYGTNENKMVQNCWDTAEAVLGGKVIVK